MNILNTLFTLYMIIYLLTITVKIKKKNIYFLFIKQIFNKICRDVYVIDKRNTIYENNLIINIIYNLKYLKQI